MCVCVYATERGRERESLAHRGWGKPPLTSGLLCQRSSLPMKRSCDETFLYLRHTNRSSGQEAGGGEEEKTLHQLKEETPSTAACAAGDRVTQSESSSYSR